MSDHQSDGTDDAISGTMLAGKYRVRRELGRGLIGRVYLCRSSWNDALVAVKVLHPELAQMPGMAKRFLHELRAITQLDQQNIVPVFESGEDANQGLLYLAMEHIEGRNLAEVIEHDWPLSDARVVDLMSQLLRALARAHAIGIVHRDLKPTNVFVRASREGERDRVLVGDFSLAQLAPVWLPNASSDPAARAAGAQLLRGTAEYASPEQAQGKPLDPRSDVYSAGVLLFQMLTRTLPFMAANAADIGAQHCGKPPPPPSGFGKVNEALEAACLKALSKTRDARFQTANEMRDALEAAVGAEASSRPQRESISSWRGGDMAGARAREKGLQRTPQVSIVLHERAASKLAARSTSLAPHEREVPSSLDTVPKRHPERLLMAALALALVAWGGYARFVERSAPLDRADRTPVQPAALERRTIASNQFFVPPEPVAEPQPMAADPQMPQPMAAADGPDAPAVDAQTPQPMAAEETPPANAQTVTAPGPQLTAAEAAAQANVIAAQAAEQPAPPSAEVPATPARASATAPAVEAPAAVAVADRFDDAKPETAPGALKPVDANLASTRPALQLDAPAAEPKSEPAPAKPTAPIAGRTAPASPASKKASGQDAHAVHESELLAEKAKIAIGSIFTRADVPAANLRDAIDPTRVTDCYRATLLLGTRPRSSFEGWLDITTNEAGHVAEASMRGARLPAELRSCIEHVARTSRIVAPNAGSILVSYPITFQQP